MISTAKKIIKKVLTFSNTPSIENNIYQYSQLTPIDNANIQEYDSALSQALRNDKVKNIALTGSYGSGKSSVLRTFEKKYKDSNQFKFLNISLATFNVEYKTLNDADEKNKIQINNSIEKSLLQQIIFKVRSGYLEDSNFNRIKIKNFWSNSGLALILMAWTILIYFIFVPENDLFKDNILFNKDYLGLYQSFVFFISICLIQHLINLLPRLKLSKLGIASAEISFNENKGDSVLNKYLDELIYFFSKTKFNILIIEDLDRFKNLDIFVNLRELNILLNNSDEIIKRKKIIKFVYALGDDVFESIDRTKFFDFIIPIIPVVNSTNSAEILRTEIKKAFENHNISDDFFNEVTIYIDDMRLLLNITNEFVIYKKKLAEISKIQLKDEKLLGLIIYKNKYPHDFVELNYRRGIVANAFSNKSDIQKQIIAKLEEEISLLSEDVNEIEAENINSIEELIKVYLFTITNQMNGPVNIRFESSRTFLPILDFIDESRFEIIRKQNSITYQMSNGSVQNLNFSFSDIEKTVNESLSFSKRMENIKKRGEGRISVIKTAISQKRKSIEINKSLNLKQLIKLNQSEDFLERPEYLELAKIDDNNKTSDLSLIKYLLSEGYIEEDYESYMSFFYEGELSSRDKQFLISVLSNAPLPFDYGLNNAKNITKKIVKERFRNRAIFNINLFQYLISQDENHDYVMNAFNAIIDHEIDGYNFVNDFISASPYELVKLIIRKISQIKINYWENIIRSPQIHEHQLIYFLRDLLNHFSKEDLSNANKNGFFTNYLSEYAEIFELLERLSIDKCKELINELNIKFTDLSSCNNEELLNFIDKNNAYEISAVNIKKLLKNSNENYTTIITSENANLIQNIDKNINEYVNNVLLESNLDVVESELAIIKLLNNEDLLTDSSKEIINTLQFKINDINLINNKDFWESIVSESKMSCIWENVLAYFLKSDNELDEHLIEFLNIPENYEMLSKVKLDAKEKGFKELRLKIIHSNEINDAAYKVLITSITFNYPDLSDLSVSAKKVESLLVTRKFQLTKLNYDFIKSELGDLAFILIEQNPIVFIKNPELFDVDVSEYEKLVSSDYLSVDNKIQIIQTIPKEHFKSDSIFSNDVASFAISNSKLKLFDEDITESLIEMDIDSEVKFALFNRCSSELTQSKIKTFVEKIDKVSGLLQGKKPLLAKTDNLLKLCEFLKSKNYISFKEVGDSIRITPKSIFYS